jgi:hypothetical protein
MVCGWMGVRVNRTIRYCKASWIAGVYSKPNRSFAVLLVMKLWLQSKMKGKVLLTSGKRGRRAKSLL